MKIRYPARFTPNEKQEGFDVTLPHLGGGDLEWCTWGGTLDEARMLASELVTSYLDLCAKCNDEILPSPIALPDGEGWEWARPEIGAELAIEIRAIRLERGLTQVQAADLMGVKQSTYSRWESPAKCNPTVATLQRLSRVFHAELTVAVARRAARVS